MKDAINYLKFDLRIIKKTSKQYLLIVLIPFIVFIIGGNLTFAISYFLLFLIVLAAIPFNMQGNEKSTEMYYMFPTKISNMVLGRFLYLMCSAFLEFVIIGIGLWYLYMINKFQSIEILATCLSEVVSLIICLIQYPLYYKIGLENSRIISIAIYLIPASIVFALPNILNDNLNFNTGNVIILIFFSLLFVIFIGCISYFISYKICIYKEI